MLTFEQALAVVCEKVGISATKPALESVPLIEARGRILAENLIADRDYPPFNRSIRDGYAVRSAEVDRVPATLEVVGLARAGEPFAESVASRTNCAVEIMTGAPLPEGTDSVVMIEHTREAVSHAPDAGARQKREVEILRRVEPFENLVRKGREAASGGCVLGRGSRLGPGEIGLAASIGCSQVRVFARPRVAILPTGDEVVPVDRKPEWFQIRNSNALTLAAQVEAAGGIPQICGVAADNKRDLRCKIEEALGSDLVVLSGGISVGKFDFVAEVLAELGTEFYIQGVALRPGKPLTFGQVRERLFFALPGNPVSTFVTFELFVRPAIAALGGAPFQPPVFLKARLGKPVRQKTGLSVFMPARVTAESTGRGADGQTNPVVERVGWQGSGDLVGLAEANCFLVIHPNQTELAPGDWVDVLPKTW